MSHCPISDNRSPVFRRVGDHPVVAVAVEVVAEVEVESYLVHPLVY